MLQTAYKVALLPSWQRCHSPGRAAVYLPGSSSSSIMRKCTPMLHPVNPTLDQPVSIQHGCPHEYQWTYYNSFHIFLTWTTSAVSCKLRYPAAKVLLCLPITLAGNSCSLWEKTGNIYTRFHYFSDNSETIPSSADALHSTMAYRLLTLNAIRTSRW